LRGDWGGVVIFHDVFVSGHILGPVLVGVWLTFSTAEVEAEETTTTAEIASSDDTTKEE